MALVSFSGLASGIDTEAIIKTIIDARRLQSTPLSNKKDYYQQENKALEEFTSKLLGFNDVVKDFLTLSGNAVTKRASSSQEDAVEVVAGSGAINASTTLKVLQLAQTGTASLEQSFESLDDKILSTLDGAAKMSIQVGSGDGQHVIDLEVNSETTVSDLANAINNAGKDLLHASIVNLGTSATPNYKLSISSAKTGLEGGSLIITKDEALSSLDFQITQATDAEVELSGIGTVRRSSNQISDLIPGTTINLKQAGTGSVVIAVHNDVDKTAKKVGDMVAALNEIIKYSQTNSKIERVQGEKGVNNVYGSLSRTRVDNQAVEAIRIAIDSADSGRNESAVRIFADLGIATERDGTLSFNADKFTEAAGSDPNAVEKLLHDFGDRVGSSAGVIADYTKYKGALEQSRGANDSIIKDINDHLSRLEQELEDKTQSLRLMFSRLEQNIARLNSGADALQSLSSANLPRARR